MTVNLTLALLVGVLVGSGVTLLMSRGMIRAFIGVLLMSNGVNLLFLVASGSPGRPPIVDDTGSEAGMADPLPQALVLTAIVITLALTGFGLALAHRSWDLSRSDVVADDDEDTRIGVKAEANDMSDSDFGAAAAQDDDGDPDPGGSHHVEPGPASDGAR